MRFYTTVALSARKALTPEGFLVCYDVPAARVGELLYYENELVPSDSENPLVFGEDGTLRVLRGPDEVFRPETLASALGKPLVNEHPDDDVTIEDWSELAVGIILNPRRGEGTETDLFLIDIMVTTREGIEAINSGKRELSFGYDAHYRVLGKGRAEQFNIVINHVALVEQGRCGPRCAVRDAAPRRNRTTPADHEIRSKPAFDFNRAMAKRYARTSDAARAPVPPRTLSRQFDFNAAMAERYGRATRLD